MPLSISPDLNRSRVNVMRVKIHRELKKSIHPKKFRIQGEQGYCIQVVGDGYCLIEFAQFINGRECLQWYVHETDFYILNKGI